MAAGDRIPADSHAGALTKATVRRLLDRFVGQGAGTGHDSHLARQVNLTRHDADLALAGGNHTRAVGTDQAHVGGVQVCLDRQHVQRRNAFGDADDQFDAGVHGFQNGVFTERCRDIDHRCGGARGIHSLTNRIEYRHARGAHCLPCRE